MKYADRQSKNRVIYTIKDYRDDAVHAFTLSGPERGAALTAASKRLKQQVIISELVSIACSENIDVTPTLAKQVINEWVGRGISYLVLMDWFAMDQRTASDKSRDFGRLDLIIEKGKKKVLESLSEATENMKLIRLEVSSKRKVSNKQRSCNA